MASEFQQKLTQLRKTTGFSRERIARQVGVSMQTIYRWETGQTTPRSEAHASLFSAFEAKHTTKNNGSGN